MGIGSLRLVLNNMPQLFYPLMLPREIRRQAVSTLLIIGIVQRGFHMNDGTGKIGRDSRPFPQQPQQILTSGPAVGIHPEAVQEDFPTERMVDALTHPRILLLLQAFKMLVDVPTGQVRNIPCQHLMQYYP